MVTQNDLSKDEVKVVEAVREIINGSGFGDVEILIQKGEIVIVKLSTTIKL